MSQDQTSSRSSKSTLLSTVVTVEVWASFLGGLVCVFLFGGWPMHPKGGDGEIRLIIAFSCLSAVGVGLSLIGIRYSKGFTKIIAFLAFALFALVVLNLANELIHV